MLHRDTRIVPGFGCRYREETISLHLFGLRLRLWRRIDRIGLGGPV